ncbi:YQK1 protein, partial [Amia calva]|nr:YQK1 protein [Amia calva]
MNEAFTEIGFVYLKNTGIDQEQVNEVMEISKEFFLLPEDIKKKFSISTQPNFPYFGWVSVETERLNPDRPGDLKEVYGVTTLHPDIVWPPEDTVAGFQKTMESFFNRCEQLSLRILRVMALILGLEGNFFLDKHNEMSGNKNGTTLSTLYYPSVDMSSVKEGQIRCGEHSDYGSITLLFQSDKSGLEVMNQAGEYISAPPIPGAVLINIADLMQRWTCDRFVSAKHRVILTPPGDKSTRQSLAFFVHPDDNAMISSFDGSDKYAPINALDYLNERLSDTFSM